MALVAAILAFKSVCEWVKTLSVPPVHVVFTELTDEEGGGVFVFVSHETYDNRWFRSKDLARLRRLAATGRLKTVQVICFDVLTYSVERNGKCHVKKVQNYHDEQVNTLAEAAGGVHKLAFLF